MPINKILQTVMNNKEMARKFFNINISIRAQIQYYTYEKTTTEKLMERGKD